MIKHLVFFVASFVSLAGARAQVAVLTDASGTVKVTNSRTGDSKVLRKGEAITRFDKITVPKDGQAQFVFSNGNTLQLGSDSTVAVDDYEFDKVTGLDHTSLSLENGKARFSSPNSYAGIKNSALLKTKKMSLSGKSSFNVVVEASEDKVEAVNIGAGEIEVGVETVKRQVTPLETLKAGSKIRNKNADELAADASKPFTLPEEVEASQLETTKKEMDRAVDKSVYENYARANPSFATRYKPAAYQKLRRRMKQSAKK